MTDDAEFRDEPETNPHDQDRFPTWERLLSRLMDAELVPEDQVQRVEIECGAAGDITYRYWPARADEYEFSYLGQEQE